MTALGQQLMLERCPHCAIHKPLLQERAAFETLDHAGASKRLWKMYVCGTCGGVITAMARTSNLNEIRAIYPSPQQVDDIVPERAREFLKQAIGSLSAPSGAVMLSASAVDAMLKAKDYRKGNLNARIDKAAEDHLITDEMAAWAHDIRLDANDERHADEDAALPTEADARRCVEFAQALAEFLFVLPERVKRGRATK